MLMDDRIIFCTCLMADIFAVMNMLPLALQKKKKKKVLPIDIKLIVQITIKALTKLSTANSALTVAIHGLTNTKI